MQTIIDNVLQPLYDIVGREKVLYLFFVFVVLPFIFKTFKKLITTALIIFALYLLYIHYGQDLLSAL